MMNPELLAPAGSPEALHAAIAAGADAIYLGASSHGARASAGFDDQALENAIHLAHLHGRRIYVTVNTLTKQGELPLVRELLSKLQAFRADAVIVQDLGLARVIQSEFPGLCVHASTQMSVHNAHGANVLKRLGITRAVLARECDEADIRRVADTGIEVEVFVHGALCVSVSGQCLFSAMIGGRSGNRGRCAQPCRLQYTYKENSGALLSMHDLNTLNDLPGLLNMGARSFKIEGRLKRPEYVYAVTAAYRKVLDRAINGLPPGDLIKEQLALEQLYSRGFTKGHALGAQDSALIGPKRVSHWGLPLGKVVSARQREGFVLAQVALNGLLNNGDGLQVRGKTEQDCIYSGPPIGAKQLATLRLRELPQPGDSVWRLQDEAQLAWARSGYETLPFIPVTMSLETSPGLPATLQVSARGITVTVTGEPAQPALNQALTHEGARKALGKTGGTPFTLDHLDYVSTAPVFMPAACLNALRRDALEQLEQALIKAHPLPERLPRQLPGGRQTTPLNIKKRLFAILGPGMDREAICKAGAQVIIRCPDNYRETALEGQLDELMPEDVLLLPRQADDLTLMRLTALAQKRNIPLMADNIGQLDLPGVSFSGEGIPAWNAESLQELKDHGIKALVLSRELSAREINALPPHTVELIMPVYGRTALMQLAHCPERQSRGLSKNKAGCTFCMRNQGIKGQALVDRMSASYPLLPTHFDKTCLIALYHHTPTHLMDLAPDTSWLVDLRLLSPDKAVEITAYYAELMQGLQPATQMNREAGRYLLGVE